jgi:hypothetical protein
VNQTGAFSSITGLPHKAVSRALRTIPILVFIAIWTAAFIWVYVDKSAQARRDFAASQNDNDGLEFSTSGPFDRTIVITMFPADRPEEDSLVGFVVHDSEGKEMRDGLRSHGFNKISCGTTTEAIR